MAEEVDDMIVGRVHKNQWKELKDDINMVVASKIKQRIEQKKNEFVQQAREEHGIKLDNSESTESGE